MTLRMPRLLPVTIAAMAALFAAKSVTLVLAAVPASAETHSPAAAAHAPPSPSLSGGKEVRPGPAASEAKEPPPGEPPVEKIVLPSDPPVSASERALLLDLRRRRTELDAREATITAREGVLAAAEHRLSVRVDELTSLQTRLEALEAGRRDRDEANWRGLVKLYETMKPRDAAAIFNDLEMSVLLQVMDRMKEARAAPVLSAMQPERARQVTSELAQLRIRNNTVGPADAVAAPAASGITPAARRS